jgi:hypothetical protein
MKKLLLLLRSSRSGVAFEATDGDVFGEAFVELQRRRGRREQRLAASRWDPCSVAGSPSHSLGRVAPEDRMLS